MKKSQGNLIAQRVSVDKLPLQVVGDSKAELVAADTETSII